MQIMIVDYGLGNHGSIINMLRYVGQTNVGVASDPCDIEAADKIILPGVGHFDTGMKELARGGMMDALNAAVIKQGKPVLGICLGMQLMALGSDEGRLPGLGWIDTRFTRFCATANLPIRVPHMGWNGVTFGGSHPLGKELMGAGRFYFVHSFHMADVNHPAVIGVCTYGRQFAAAFAYKNIVGVQFHPEKSHRFGAAFLSAFTKL